MKKLLLILFLTLSFQVFSAQNQNYFEIDFTLSTFCVENPKVQYRNNNSAIFLPNEEEGITATSICVYKDGYEQYRSKGDYKNGKKVGKHISWYRNGQKSSEVFYINGKPEGKWLHWFDDGKKYFESNYINGKIDGKSTGWNRGGGILKEHNYKEGLKEGKAYLSSFLYYVEGNYKAGLPNGNWTWFFGGKKWKEGVFSKGKLLGDCNNLIDIDNFEGTAKVLFSIEQERNPGCDIDTILIPTPYFSNGEWI